MFKHTDCHDTLDLPVAFHRALSEREVGAASVLVDRGRVVTSGAATSFLNLALLLIELLLGSEIARASSRMFLIDVKTRRRKARTPCFPDDEAIHRAEALIATAGRRPARRCTRA